MLWPNSKIVRQVNLLEVDRKEARRITWNQIKLISQKTNTNHKKLMNPSYLQQFYLALGAFDMNLSTKWSVSTCLYGASLESLGTEKHRKYLEDALNLKGKNYECFS